MCFLKKCVISETLSFFCIVRIIMGFPDFFSVFSSEKFHEKINFRQTKLLFPKKRLLNISADHKIFFPILCIMHDRIIRTVPGAEGYLENQVSESGMVWLPGALGGPVADAGKNSRGTDRWTSVPVLAGISLLHGENSICLIMRLNRISGKTVPHER